MQMRGALRVGGDLVNIEVEAGLHERKLLEPGLLSYLPARRFEQRHVFGLHVPARLEPKTELSVMNQEQAGLVGAEHKCARGEVARLKELTREGAGKGGLLEQLGHACARRSELWQRHAAERLERRNGDRIGRAGHRACSSHGPAMATSQRAPRERDARAGTPLRPGRRGIYALRT